MPATPSGSTIIAFTPRQVLLSNQTMKNIVDNGTLTLEPEQKLLLHQSIANYLHHTGFSKSLKKFRSEAKIEKDNLEASSIDLEEIYLKYLEIRAKDAKSNINDEREQDVSKNKEEGKSKEKKKKSKITSESIANDVEDDQLELPTLITEKKVKDDVKTEKKSKDKKKKKDKTGSQGDAVKQIEDTNDTDSKKDKALDQEVGEDKKKDSKKRKRSTSEENDQNVADGKDDETKRKKVENLNADLGSDVDQLQKTPNQHTNGKTNGHLESAGEKLSVQKSQKSQEKGSEQKTAKKAFQRVEADKVEFADERLQDNSYWAKDGAESGYGAKAQEILGQVRGKDFRHEKTKKKRGTYRGGQIDLYSHSVKFNYSDEE
ncbi:unnamed protein product [Lupinus luteus]|uniref:LisH domain-containing protein n=1 Tax=Lupinus luteus TaxID=3873 RepID=A0AAV1Y8T0_LUPLU